MKVMILVALVTVCFVGLATAAPYVSRNAERKELAQRAVVQGYLSSMLGYLNKKQVNREDALAQGMIDYLKQKLNQQKQIAAAEFFPSCVCFRSPCPCDGHPPFGLGK